MHPYEHYAWAQVTLLDANLENTAEKTYKKDEKLRGG